METQATTERAEVPALLTCAEAAALARCSRLHIWRLVQRGQIPAVRIGLDGPVRLHRDTFVQMLRGDR